MKNFIKFFCLILLLLRAGTVEAQTPKDPWTASQLMPTEELANELNKPTKPKALVINIGPQAVIKGSVDVGPGKEQSNISKLEKMLEKESKTREIVIYCGCCPFDKCPNIRPAFNLLKDKGFTKAKLLNIPKNIKTDWIDHGYPVLE